MKSHGNNFHVVDQDSDIKDHGGKYNGGFEMEPSKGKSHSAVK